MLQGESLWLHDWMINDDFNLPKYELAIMCGLFYDALGV
jgi:hypothetical protein